MPSVLLLITASFDSSVSVTAVNGASTIQSTGAVTINAIESDVTLSGSTVTLSHGTGTVQLLLASST